MAGLQNVTNGDPLDESTVDEIALQALPQYANAAARDADAVLTAALREGVTVKLLDTNCESTYTGSAWSTDGPLWGALTSWTPVITQGATPTFTTTYAKYTRTGRWIEGACHLVLTSAGTAGNLVALSGMPAAAALAGTYVGFGALDDVSAPLLYPFSAYVFSSTVFHLRQVGVGTTAALRVGDGASTFSDALASGDLLHLNFAYEASADA